MDQISCHPITQLSIFRDIEAKIQSSDLFVFLGRFFSQGLPLWFHDFLSVQVHFLFPGKLCANESMTRHVHIRSKFSRPFRLVKKEIFRAISLVGYIYVCLFVFCFLIDWYIKCSEHLHHRNTIDFIIVILSILEECGVF